MQINDDDIVTHETIAALAQELCLARGDQPGDPQADWLRAETELHALVRRIRESLPQPAPAPSARLAAEAPRSRAPRRR